MNKQIETAEGMLRPYEKCESFGPESLTDAELVAVIIKSGVNGMSAVELAHEILYNPVCGSGFTMRERADTDLSHSGLTRLKSITKDELLSYRGVGRAKCIQLLCLSELSKRMARERAVRELNVSSPASVADYYMEELRHKSEEEVHLMLLNAKNSMISDVIVSKGTVNASMVSPREVFLTALRFQAASMILVHNHPSGDPTPSREDISLSNNIFRLGKMMNIPLVDSIIIGDRVYMSFMERSLFRA